MTSSSLTSFRLNPDLSISAKNHVELLQYLRARLDIGSHNRDRRIDSYRYIDNEYYSFLLRDKEDKERARANRRGAGVRPTDQKLALMFSQIDDAVTYLLTLLAPESGFYKATTAAEYQYIADAVATRMNEDSDQFQQIRALALFLNLAIRYNFAAISPFWTENFGKIIDPATNSPVFGITNRGNNLVAHDPWNFLFDPSVKLPELTETGEYFATVDRVTPFRLKLMTENERLFNLPARDPFMAPVDRMYFRTKPDYRERLGELHGGGLQSDVDWQSFFGHGFGGAASDSDRVVERIQMYAYVRPRDFGLGKSNRYEIWHFVIINSSFIGYAEPFNANHSMLPVGGTTPVEDNYDHTVGYSERLIPHQTFGSFVLNAHQRAVRKNLFGLTIFDKTTFPSLATKAGEDEPDMMGGRIAANMPPDPAQDIRKKIFQIFDGPDTTRSLENLQVIEALMQSILPTEMLKQVAQLDRATQYQAAAVVQSASKRLLKIGKLIDSQCLSKVRVMQMSNLLQYLPEISAIGPDGKVQSIQTQQIYSVPVKFRVSDGLRGLDVLALVLHLKEILMAVLQSGQAQNQIDVVGLIDYITTLLGDYTDFKQFKIGSPIDLLPPDQRNMAFQLLEQYQQQAAARPNNAEAAQAAPVQI